MKIALALVIGMGKYEDKGDVLSNSVNDAIAVSKAFQDVGIDVILKTDCTIAQFKKESKEFQTKLESYPTALFYYSGHAFQADRENYLSAIDTDFSDEDEAVASSLPLHLIIKRMSKFDPEVKIVIMDACRTGLAQQSFRSTGNSLAPVAAPKGTLIAFSTSPGQRAADFGKEGHSIYTGNLLEHLRDPNVPVEVIFKRVRASVHDQSRGKQTPWEHTSMIHDFYFRTTHISVETALIYENQSLRYEQFVPKGGLVDKVILDLLSTQFNEHKRGVEKIDALAAVKLSASEQFLLGRAFLSAANYGSFSAIDKLKIMGQWLQYFETKGGNHFLNGMLFEVYFDEKGRLRRRYFKNAFLDILLTHLSDKRFEKSLTFIRDQLQPYRGSLLYLPGDEKVILNITFEKQDWQSPKKEILDYYVIKSIKVGGEIIFKSSKHDDVFDNYREKIETFKTELAKQLVIPKDKIKIITAHNINDIKYVGIPSSLDLSKYTRHEE